MQALIKLRGLSKVFLPDYTALEPLTLQIEAGEFICIAGASGAGKSTLLKLLYTHLEPGPGQYHYKGQDVLTMGAGVRLQMRREIAVVFQDFLLLREKTALENVAVAPQIRGIGEHAARELSEEMLSMVGLAHRVHALPSMLSGGEQQRVALARALIMRPRLIVADEPTGNLDPEMSAHIFDLLLRANTAGATVIVATHNFAAIDALGKRTLVLDRGKLIGDFPAYSLLKESKAQPFGILRTTERTV
jgi:cell division transport system ATP-binding protein